MAYSPRELMTKAWAAARLAARRFGGSARQYLREALRQAWFAARPVAERVAIMRARVLAEVARITAEASARPTAPVYVLPPSSHRAFTATATARPAPWSPHLRQAAVAAREVDRAAVLGSLARTGGDLAACAA